MMKDAWMIGPTVLSACIWTASLGPAVAGDNKLTPALISTFQAKVAQARDTQKAVGGREICLSNYVGDLHGRSDERERALGESRRREQDLASSLDRIGEEQRQYDRLFQDEQRNFEERDRELQSAMAEQREQDRRLHECRRVLTILSGLCDIGDEAVRKLGWMRDVQSQIGDIHARLARAQNGLHDAQRRLTDSQNALAQVRDQASSAQNAIREIEGEIARAKTTISDLHANIQTYNILIADFTSMLDEANDVDAESPRAKQIVRLSTEVDDLTSRAPSLIAFAESVLPEGKRQNCAPR